MFRCGALPVYPVLTGEVDPKTIAAERDVLAKQCRRPLTKHVRRTSQLAGGMTGEPGGDGICVFVGDVPEQPLRHEAGPEWAMLVVGVDQKPVDTPDLDAALPEQDDEFVWERVLPKRTGKFDKLLTSTCLQQCPSALAHL